MLSATLNPASVTISPSEDEQTWKWRKEPSALELTLLAVLTCVSFGTAASTLGGWHTLALTFGDNGAYFEVATAIRHRDLRSIAIQHFMGYPYAIAGVSLVSRLSLFSSLWLAAFVASVGSIFLVARMFGTWVAAFFGLSNFAWIQVSFLGGSGPLAVALGMGAFWSFRRERPLLAALLGSLATTVRPLMFFTLVGIGITLLCQKRYAKFFGALAVGLTICLLYIWPLARYFGDRRRYRASRTPFRLALSRYSRLTV